MEFISSEVANFVGFDEARGKKSGNMYMIARFIDQVGKPVQFFIMDDDKKKQVKGLKKFEEVALRLSVQSEGMDTKVNLQEIKVNGK